MSAPPTVSLAEVRLWRVCTLDGYPPEFAIHQVANLLGQRVVVQDDVEMVSISTPRGVVLLRADGFMVTRAIARFEFAREAIDQASLMVARLPATQPLSSRVELSHAEHAFSEIRILAVSAVCKFKGGIDLPMLILTNAQTVTPERDAVSLWLEDHTTNTRLRIDKDGRGLLTMIEGWTNPLSLYTDMVDCAMRCDKSLLSRVRVGEAIATV